MSDLTTPAATSVPTHGNAASSASVPAGSPVSIPSPTPSAPPAAHPGRPANMPAGARAAGPSAPVKRQFVSFLFYKLLPEFRRLPLDQQRTMLDQFAQTV